MKREPKFPTDLLPRYIQAAIAGAAGMAIVAEFDRIGVVFLVGSGAGTAFYLVQLAVAHFTSRKRDRRSGA